jgi:hypothetical protein
VLHNCTTGIISFVHEGLADGGFSLGFGRGLDIGGIAQTPPYCCYCCFNQL